jgi:hypothetical protein
VPRRSLCSFLIVAALVACKHHAAIPEDPKPTLPLAAFAPAALCVTKGALASASITVPTFRAIVKATAGDAASLAFVYRGDSEGARALASGQIRRQLGLKLRAANGCNLIYVMWRMDPRPELEVSVKSNPGKRTHKECGADGYTKVKPIRHGNVPALVAGAAHTLHAEIAGDVLAAWIDGTLAWVGELPDEAHDLTGPAGMRSDNVQLDITQFSAVAGIGGGSGSGGSAAGEPKCGSGSAEAEPDADEP